MLAAAGIGGRGQVTNGRGNGSRLSEPLCSLAAPQARAHSQAGRAGRPYNRLQTWTLALLPGFGLGVLR